MITATIAVLVSSAAKRTAYGGPDENRVVGSLPHSTNVVNHIGPNLPNGFTANCLLVIIQLIALQQHKSCRARGGMLS
jgi:hypothetical protein